MTDTQTQNLTPQQLEENGFRQMAQYLEELLVRQIERIRRYDLDSALELGEESNKLAAALTQNDVLNQSGFEDEKFRIHRLYKDLEMIIETERSEVADKLKQIRQGIKTLGAYGNTKER